jgi:Domain of unknown function (DUF1508).
MRKPKIQVIIYKAKDGFRWHMKRSGRIIAESGEGYTRLSSVKRIVKSLIESITGSLIEFFEPEKG